MTTDITSQLTCPPYNPGKRVLGEPLVRLLYRALLLKSKAAP